MFDCFLFICSSHTSETHVQISTHFIYMMMMSRFVERVINGSQTRCRSAEQVGFQMSSERQWAESCGSYRAADKLFQMTGPAKLLIPAWCLSLTP